MTKTLHFPSSHTYNVMNTRFTERGGDSKKHRVAGEKIANDALNTPYLSKLTSEMDYTEKC